ncbi:MAG: putative peptidoglycan-binding domain-containing protein, partial [Pseudomonadota bacterium]
IKGGLAACEAAVQSEPDNARFRYQLARLQQSARQFDKAYDNMQVAEAAGHIRAKYGLAVLLDTKRVDRDVVEIPYDPDRARELLEAGIVEQDPYAMHRLGQNMMRNGETETDRQRGFELLERSVELGHTFAMNELGFYFLTKDTDHYIPERGMRYLRASELREDIYGYNNLGFVALSGLDGNPADFARAERYFEAAADGGHPNAPANIARMILRDQLKGRSMKEALQLYDTSLERGDAWGGANGATIILNGSVPGRGPADAAVRAAKAVHLANAKGAGTAREKLAGIPEPALNRGLQMVLKELGQSITVDGQVGPATLRALETVSAENGVPLAFGTDSDPVARLLQATRVYWAQNPVRFDLF